MAKPQRYISNPGIPFDPLQYVKRLESVGFTREQAEAQAETFLAVVQEQLISKQDLKDSETQLASQTKELELKASQQIKELDANLTRQIKELEAKTTLEIEVLRRDLKIWFGGMLVGLVVVMSGIMTLIVHLGGR